MNQSLKNQPTPFPFLVVLLVLAPVLSFVGCGDNGPALGRVSGIVTIDGQPLPNATLTFVPTAGTPSYGMTDKEGKYTLMFTDTKYGAEIGEHAVTVEVTKLSKGEIEEMKASGLEVHQSNVELPKHYRKPGALSAKVEAGSNTIDFPLTSKQVN